MKGIVGISSGQAGQTFELCGERPVDCLKKNGLDPDKYIWVETGSNGEFKRWINISYLSGPDIATIDLDIANGTNFYNGEYLFGTYEGNLIIDNVIRFTNPSYIPQAGARIEVRYDSRFPVEVFGGDTTVGIANFPIVHRRCNDGGGDKTVTQLKWNRPMPYRWYKFKENYYLTRDTTGLIPVIQSNDLGTHPDDCELGAIRQMILLYFCQSYSHLPLAYGDFYPNVHYVQRPSRWVQDKKPHEQFIYSDYENDFPDEEKRWRYGGFRFKQFMFNLDYSKENIHDKYLAVSQLQFKENTWFPNRLAWSETRPIQVSMSPNLKTFRPFNIFDISDNRGEIKLLYSVLNSTKGENIYAFCADDICIAMTRKRTLFDVAGNQLGVTGNQIGTSFILGHIVTGKQIGRAHV